MKTVTIKIMQQTPYMTFELAGYKTASGLKKPCFVKSLPKELSDDIDFRDRLFQEANLAEHLTHPTFATMIELIKEGDQCAVVYEYTPGAFLSEIIAKASKIKFAISVPMAVNVATEVLQALRFANERATDNYGEKLSTVLGSVTPDHVYVATDGIIRMFDVASNLNDPQSIAIAGPEPTRRTAYGEPDPTQDSATLKTSVYQTGIVLLECLGTGAGLNLPNKIEDLTSNGVELPNELLMTLEWMLTPNSDERLSPKDAEKQLLKFLHKNYPEYKPDRLGEFVTTVIGKQLKTDNKLIKRSLSNPWAFRSSTKSGTGNKAHEQAGMLKGRTLEIDDDDNQVIATTPDAPAHRSQEPVAMPQRAPRLAVANQAARPRQQAGGPAPQAGVHQRPPKRQRRDYPSQQRSGSNMFMMIAAAILIVVVAFVAVKTGFVAKILK